MSNIWANLLTILVGGLLVNNFVMNRFLGCCPFLGVSKQYDTAKGMSMAVIFVMTLASFITWFVQHLILVPLHLEYMQTIAFILVIAVLVGIVEMALKKISPSLYQSLGVYLSLIVVNCIILGRAEMYASKHGVVDSAIDGAGMGIGFTLAICAMAAIRETLGCGTFCGLPVPWFHENPIGILTMAPGGFFVFGCMIALINKISKGKAIKKKEFGCAGCPGCGKGACEGKEAAAK